MSRARGDEGAIGSLLRLRERVAIWCATLALIGGAVFLWDPPAEVVDEIAWHRELALGCGVFGGLMFLALVFRGQAGYRLRALLLVCLAAVVAAGLLWWCQGVAQDVWALKQRGEIRRVQVVGSSMKHNPKTKKTTQLARVSIDGAIVSVEFGRLPRRGEWVEVLTAPDRPDAAVPAAVKKDWLALLDAKMGIWIGLLVVFALLFCVVSLPINLWHVLAGAPRGTDPDAHRP